MVSAYDGDASKNLKGYLFRLLPFSNLDLRSQFNFLSGNSPKLKEANILTFLILE